MKNCEICIRIFWILKIVVIIDGFKIKLNCVFLVKFLKYYLEDILKYYLKFNFF